MILLEANGVTFLATQAGVQISTTEEDAQTKVVPWPLWDRIQIMTGCERKLLPPPAQETE